VCPTCEALASQRSRPVKEFLPGQYSELRGSEKPLIAFR
jgi:hypothetical protein